ncbi:MAG: Bug family tripartite tricarboxylate transporter substrate binding protein [Alphaproteobacteria bacterium]
MYKFKPVAVALAALCVWASPAAAQEAFPNKPVRIIVPFGSGSGSDLTSRYLSDALAGPLGQPVVVDNKPGADGAIGAAEFLKTPPDGHTLFVGSVSSNVLNPLMVKDLRYKPSDFRPVAGLLRSFGFVATGAKSRFPTFASFADAARAAPEAVSMASYSPTIRLASVWLESLVGARVNHIPYRTANQIGADLLGNHVDVALMPAAAATSLVESGQLRALAYSGETRHPLAPDVPTVREAGLPDYVWYTWIAFYVRPGTPDPIVRRLEEVVLAAVRSDAFRTFADKNGSEPMPFDAARIAELETSSTAIYRRLLAATEGAPR